jgi:peptidoglycan/xylan/chitin deacetylase (PgdA/CDA1 family)
MRKKSVAIAVVLVTAIASGHSILALFPHEALADELPVYVNLQIDAEGNNMKGLSAMADELLARNMRTTVYVSGRYANEFSQMISWLSVNGFEIALHGYNTGEQLATMTFKEQKELLRRAKQAVEGCSPCGTYRSIFGFRPQYFSQNEDTYRLIDEFGFTYNSGFKAGELFTEGHSGDTYPYKIEGHNFYAVPVTTLTYNGKNLYICDIASAQREDLKLTGEQWSEVLNIAFERAVKKKEPLVVLLHDWYTGDMTGHDYWQPFVDFLDMAKDRAVFVKTIDLVRIAAEK